MNFEKIKEVVKVLVGAFFTIVAILGLEFGVAEGTVLQLIDLLFALLGGVIGGPAAVRFVMGKALVDKESLLNKQPR